VWNKKWPTAGLDCPTQLGNVSYVPGVMLYPQFQQAVQIDCPDALHLRLAI
jgi:hypothetical protein